MAKGKSTSFKMISKQELRPTMEFLPLSEDGSGFFVKELGGAALLEYREIARQIEAEANGAEFSTEQNIRIMTELVYRTACNEDGSLFFESMEEVKAFADKSLVKLEQAGSKALEVSKGANKNLKNAPNSSSTAS